MTKCLVTPEEKEWAIRSILKRRECMRRNHVDHGREYGQRYRQEHSDKVAVQHLQYNQEHREKIAEQRRLYDLGHKEKRAEYDRRFYQEHPEVHREARRRQRVLVMGSNGHFTDEEFGLLCGAYDNKCVYCGRTLPLIPDHAVPLSRGGSDNIENIVPACVSCNRRKYTKTYDEYVEELRSEMGVGVEYGVHPTCVSW